MSQEMSLEWKYPNIWERLFYYGSVKDCVINYSLIAVCFYPVIKSRWSRNLKTFVLSCACGLQVVIWIMVPDCYGVSLVWSYLWGLYLQYLWTEKSVPDKSKTFDQQAVIRSVGGSFVVFGYYAVTFPPITSVAHLCGAGVGWSMGSSFAKSAVLFR